MSRNNYLFLLILGLIVQFVVAHFEKVPGYLDADYYMAGGMQLAQGKGFTEPYIWTYLDNPQGLPHPSHGYWMPLASIVAALGMFVTGQQTYAAGRLAFILIAALVPALTAALAYSFSRRRDLALTSGLLAVFPVFHLPFMPVTDNYGIFMLLGGLYFLLAIRPRPWFWLGLFAGLMTLARSDGLLWLALTFLFILWRIRDEKESLGSLIRFGFSALIGFLLVMGPWYIRNFDVYGSWMSPGNSRALWLTSYDETFIYPASKLTMQSWLASGWDAIFKVRLWALWNNFQTMLAAQGHIILFPFILAGMWGRRRERRVQLGFTGWMVLFVVLSLVFPFAGVRGSFFHAGAALQPLFWSLAPLGLESVVAWARSRGWFTRQAQVVFRVAIVQIVILLSIYLVWVRLFQKGWDEGELSYPAVERYLVAQGIEPGAPVMALNPPGYYLMTRRPAIVQPYGDVQTLLAAAQRYGVKYLVFEPAGRLAPIKNLYDHPQDYNQFDYLGEVNDIRIFEIK